MTGRPILFSSPMVKAILAGRKTMTRRVVKPVRGYEHYDICRPELMMAGWQVWWHGSETHRVGVTADCPYGKPGDRLYVKEATWIWCEKREDGVTATGRPKYRYIPVGQHVVYCADSPKPNNRVDDNPAHGWRFKTARFMPRWASRITLEVTEVRVERLQEITEEDAKAEGVTSRDEFMALWDSINGKTYPWESNPWAWVVGFRVL